MYIRTVWATRTHEPESPELVTAWDEYSVDNNPDGFEADWREGLAKMEDELLEYRHVNIAVDADIILHAFAPTTILNMSPTVR